MHTLHLVSVDSYGLGTIRALREAMRILSDDEAVGIREASAALDTLREDGHALLGESESYETLAQVAAALEVNGCESLVDYDPDEPEYGREPTPEEVFEVAEGKSERADADGPAVYDVDGDDRPVFSTEAYETALALLVMTNGNPANAAAHAHLLGRTTQDGDLYSETIRCMIHTFPWLAGILAKSGIIEIVE